MYRQWITYFSMFVLAIALAFHVPSYAGAAENNVFKAHLMPVLGSDDGQPMVTFSKGTMRIKREGVRVELEMDEISAPDGASGKLELTLKINGERELITLPFDVTPDSGGIGKATLDISLLEAVDVITPGDTVEMRRARITIDGELVGMIGFLAEEEAVFDGLASVIDGLREQGHDVERGDEIIQPFFSVPGQTITLNDGERVQVFEYESPVAAETEKTLVSLDGLTIGTTAVSWVATPHFYAKGTVIMLYVGDRMAVLDALGGVLGAQFAGGKVPDTGEAVVEAVDIMILESFPVQVHVIARRHLPDGCTQIDQIRQQRNGMAFTINVTTSRPPQASCTLAIVPFEEVIVLDVLGLAASIYTVEVNDVLSSFSLEVDNVPVQTM